MTEAQAWGVRVRIPGKVMLAGEYAVLRGHPALASTVDRWLSVEARPRHADMASKQDIIEIYSELWDEPIRLRLAEVENVRRIAGLPILVEAVLAAVSATAWSRGLHVRVRSGLRVADGLGSSSAVRLGALIAVHSLAAGFGAAPLCQEQLWQLGATAYEGQLSQQGFASGYDIATQLQGGLVLFQRAPNTAWPGRIQRIPVPAAELNKWIHIFIGGGGAPTRAVGSSTQVWLRSLGLEAELAERSDAAVAAVRRFWKAKRPIPAGVDEAWPAAWHSFCPAAVGVQPSPGDENPGRPGGPRDGGASAMARGDEASLRALAELRQLLAGGPHFPHELGRALAALPGLDSTWTYKTTGAGGEDALVLFGQESACAPAQRCLEKMGWHRLEEGLSSRGVEIESCPLTEEV